MTDAMVHVKTDDTGRARETARTQGEKGAGLEIAATGTEGTETGIHERPRAVTGVPAETAALTDEDIKLTETVLVRDHQLEMVPMLDLEADHPLESIKTTVDLAAETRGIAMMDDKPMALIRKTKWISTSKRTRTKTRWKQ